jgi:tellurite resistance protein
MNHPQALKYLYPGWYALVMGLSGLALAWHRAVPLMGEAAEVAAWGWGGLAALVFALLAAATLLRAQRHPEAWAEDRRHPVRHTFIAMLPVGVLLLATVAVALTGPSRAAALLWWAGSLAQLWVTVWVLSRWWRGNPTGGVQGGVQSGAQWAGVTPALFIPVVGNVLAPLAGVPLGYSEWAAAQFGLGLLFWPVVLALILVRVTVQGLWAERLMPSLFIVIAPPAVCGLSLLQLGAPLAVAWAMWGMALFGLLWVGTQARRIVALPMGLPHWALSFPLAALAALTLRLATPGGLLAVLGPVLLALATLTVLWLLLMTLRGLRDGSLLAPELVASLTPVSPDAIATQGGDNEPKK